MFKSKQEIIVIQAEATDPITTGVVFWSHDKGTAKLLFQLKKDTVSQTLAEGTIVPILLEFTIDGGRGKHIYHAVIEDALNGIVSIVLEDNILGYVGRVDGSIYIELPDSRSLDTAGRFTFDVKRSPIDENVPELEDYYWQGFNEIMTQYHQTIATIKLEAKALLDSLTADVTKVKNDIATANVKIAEIRQKLDDNDVFTKAESSANVVNHLDNRNFADAWSWSANGADRFTTIYPNENVLKDTLLTDGANFPQSHGSKKEISTDTPSGLTYSYAKNVWKLTKTNITPYGMFTQDVLNREGIKLGDKMTVSALIYIPSDFPTTANAFYIGKYDAPTGQWVNGVTKNVADRGKWVPVSCTFTVTDTKFLVAVGFAGGAPQDKVYSFWIAGFKLEHGENLYPIVTPSSSEDRENAIPHYKGQRLADSNKPSDYDWQYTDQYVDYLIATYHVQNIATQVEAEAGTDNTKTMTPLRTAQQLEKKAVTIAGNQTVGGIKNFKDGVLLDDVPVFGITRNVVFDDAGVGGYFNTADKFSLGAVGKIEKVVLVWSRVDDSAGTLLNYSWSQTVLFPDDIILGNSYRVQLTSENYKFLTFKNESGIITISGANENSVAPNRIYRIKRIVAYIKK